MMINCDKINSEQDCKEIYEYCITRLPKLNGFSLEVQQNGTCSNKEFFPLNGITLKIYKGKYLITSSTGIDVNDALIDIYKSLLSWYMERDSYKTIERPALGQKILTLQHI